MNMYYYLYSDDEYENVSVEVVMVYYDNDDDFVLLTKWIKYPQVFNCSRKKKKKGVEKEENE